MAGRKTTSSPSPVGPDFVGATPADMAAQETCVNQALELAGSMVEERDLMNQLLGQAQMADAFAKFSLTVSTSKLLYVKENKLYRALAGKKSADGQQFSGTWDEFCSLLGRSQQHVDEEIRNIKALGEEALESMSRMGIGYRELRQYRRLPEDQKTALIEVAKAGDKEAFLDLAEEIISRHSKEKESLAKQVSDAKADLEASRSLSSEREEALQKAKAQVIKLSAGTLPLDERFDPFAEKLASINKEVAPKLSEITESIKALDNWATEYAASQPDYDPEIVPEMPREIGLLLIQANTVIESLLGLAISAQEELQSRFGLELQAAKHHVLQPQGE